MSVTTTALDRVSGERWFVATRAFRGSGVVWRVSRRVEVFVRFVCLSRVSGSPGVFERYARDPFLVVPWTFCSTVCMTVWQHDIETISRRPADCTVARQTMRRAQNSTAQH